MRERVTIVLIGLAAYLGFAGYGALVAASDDHDPKSQYGQVVFDARNRCEGMLAHVRAKLAAAESRIAELDAAAKKAPAQ